MPRAITWTRTTVPRDARETFIASLKRRRDQCRAAQCNFWVFEDAAHTGAFVQFIEARDADTLTALRATLDAPVPDAPILTEVELT